MNCPDCQTLLIHEPAEILSRHYPASDERYFCVKCDYEYFDSEDAGADEILERHHCGNALYCFADCPNLSF